MPSVLEADGEGVSLKDIELWRRFPHLQQVVAWLQDRAGCRGVKCVISLFSLRTDLDFFSLLFPLDDACHSNLLHPCTQQLVRVLKLCCVLSSVKYKLVQEPEQSQSFVHGPQCKPFVERKLCVNYFFFKLK